METQTQTQIPSRYTIDAKKLEKYLPKLLNGEANKLATWLPNMLTVSSSLIGGGIEREGYDYWLGQFRKKDPVVYQTKFALIVARLEAMRKEKEAVMAALAEMKVAVDGYHEKNRQLRF